MQPKQQKLEIQPQKANNLNVQDLRKFPKTQNHNLSESRANGTNSADKRKHHCSSLYDE